MTDNITELLRQLSEARERMLTATMRWSAANGVFIGPRSYGRMHVDDPAYIALREEAIAAELAYEHVYKQILPHPHDHHEAHRQDAPGRPGP